MTPPALERVVKKCLSKDPEERWQNMADLATQLQWVAEGQEQGTVPAQTEARRKKRKQLAWRWSPLS
jgi:serine/threonine-protein kinase